MTSFEWFLLVIVVIVVPLIIAAVVTLWTIDQANKRKRANRKDAQIGVKRQAALTPEEVVAHKAARAEKQAAEAESAADTVTTNNLDATDASSEAFTHHNGNTVTNDNSGEESTVEVEVDIDAESSKELAGEMSENSGISR